jgi:transcriptional regulator with XRE-family HTH domain
MALKEVDPRQRLRKVVARYPTQQDAAAALGIAPSYLSDMLAGKRNVSDRILAWIGLRPTVVEGKDPGGSG